MNKFIPSDYCSFDAYHKEDIRFLFSISLITFAIQNFVKAEQIKNIKLIDDFITSEGYKDLYKRTEFISNNFNIFSNALLDNVIISITFENYFKAKLLMSGFIIHEIDSNKNKKLFKLQKSEPIRISEINVNNSNEFSELKTKTLNYGILLKENDYHKYFNIDNSTLLYLKKINKRRNELHTYMSEKISLSKSNNESLNSLKSYVNKD